MWLGRRVSIIIYLGMSAPRTCRRTWWRRIRLWASPPDQTRKRWLKKKRRKRYDIKCRAFSSAAGNGGRPSLIPCPRLYTDLVFRNEKRAVDLVVGQQERHVECFEVFFVVGHDDPVSERVQTVMNVLEHTIDIVNRHRWRRPVRFPKCAQCTPNEAATPRIYFERVAMGFIGDLSTHPTCVIWCQSSWYG